MIEYPDLNLLSIILGFVISSILGFLWYDTRTPIGARYMKEMNYDPETLEVNKLYFGFDFLGRLILVWGLAFVVSISGADDFLEGLTIAIFVWFAFIFTSHWAQVAFEQRNRNVYIIYIGYQLVVFAILGPIFAVMG